MDVLKHVAAAGSMLCFLACGLAAAAPVYPLKISANGRYFVDQQNVPFFINGDTPWSLIGQVSKEDAELYISDAAARGFNSLIVTLVEGYYADNAPANYYGTQPFLTPNNFTTPNEAYFAHADWVINKAAVHGLQVILAPMYLGCCSDGWAEVLASSNSEANASWYGTWIGNRYKNVPNLMYVWGNDLNPGSLRTKIRAMAQATKAADPNHLHTYHPGPNTSALEVWTTSESWLDVNVTYTYNPVQTAVLQDYNRVPFLPFFLFEAHYENDFGGANAQQTRRQAYVAVLSGAMGHHYGNEPIWHMNGKPGDNTNSWKSHLNDEGRADMRYVRALFESRRWYELEPDQSHVLVTAGYGSGAGYAAAARTASGDSAIVYVPSGSSITVNLSRMTGTAIRCWWFNPRDGSAQLIGDRPVSSSSSFTPPSNDDWLLILDDSSKNFGAPGQAQPTATVPLPPSGLRAD